MAELPRWDDRIRIIEEPWLGDWDNYFLDVRTMVLGRTAYTALRFDLWLDGVTRDERARRAAERSSNA